MMNMLTCSGLEKYLVGSLHRWEALGARSIIGDGEDSSGNKVMSLRERVPADLIYVPPTRK